METPSAQTPVFSVLISGLQLQNITIKPLLFHLIEKKSLRSFVCAVHNLSKNARMYGCILQHTYKCWSKPVLWLATEVSLVKAIVKLGT